MHAYESHSRRVFLKSSAAAAALLALRGRLRADAPAAARPIPISLQLYSVRRDCARDFDGTLEQVAKMGYEGVEFAGYHGYAGKPQELRKRLDDLGLKGIATHIGTGSFRGDALKGTIEFHQAIGCKFLIVPGDGDFTHPEKSKPLAELFNQTAETLKPLGLFCGYHNHSGEFAKAADGKTYYDLFAERTSADVVLQQDVGWSASAGADPTALVRRYPGRMRILHFKPTVLGADATRKAIIGQDSIDWPTLIAACREVGGTEWITIEQEHYPDGKSPLECSALSLAGLKKLL